MIHTTGALLGATAALDDSSKVNSLLDCVADKMLSSLRGAVRKG